MGVLKNDVGRPSKKTKIIRGVLKLIGVLIIIALGLGVGHLIGNNKESDKKNDVKEQEIAFDVQKADEVLKNTFGDQFYYDWYDGSLNYDIDEIIFNNNEYKTTIALENTKAKSSNYSCKDFFGNDIKQYDNFNQHSWFVAGGLCYDEGGLKYYTYDDVNKTYKNMFDDGKDAVKDFIGIIYEDLYGYSDEKNAYVQISCECGFGDPVTPVYGVVDSYVKNDELYVNTVVGFAYENVLTLTNGTDVTLTDSELDDKELYKKYQDNLDKYTFKFSKENDNYKFINVEKAN